MKSRDKLYTVDLASAALILFLIFASYIASASAELSNLLTITETQITTSGSAMLPDIYGDTIVWHDNRDGNWDIYMYNLSTKKETQITTNKSDQFPPAIYGNRIVWQDYRNINGSWDKSDIYMYDLSTQRKLGSPQMNQSKEIRLCPAVIGLLSMVTGLYGQTEGTKM